MQAEQKSKSYYIISALSCIKGKKKQLTLVEGYRHLYSRGETQQRLIDGLPPPVVTVATPVELPVAV